MAGKKRTIRLAGNRFSRFNQPVPCRMCGKLTLENVNGCIGLELCAPCQEAAGLENEHSDVGHDTPVPNCPTCNKEVTR
jgi:hypothetical protein